jgi:diguanylate cyclase (GGDEF)-like protein/PAS domain S-box-containing protein
MSRLLAAGAVLVLLLATGAASAAGFRHDRRGAATAAADVRRAASRSLTTELDGVLRQTQDVAGLIGSSDNVTQAEFTNFTRPLLRGGGAASFGWIAHLRRGDRRAFERRAGVRIRSLGPDLHQRTAPEQPAYEVVVMSSSTTPSRTVGLDLSSDPVRLATLRRAAALLEPQAIPVIRLASTRRLGVAIYAPIVRTDGTVSGAAAGTFDVASLRAAIGAVLPAGAAYRLSQDGTLVARTGRLGGSPDRWEISVAGRTWVLQSSAAPAARIGSGPLALLVGGLLTVLVMLALLWVVREADGAKRLAGELARERDVADGGRRAMERRFLGAFDSAPVGMAVLDAAGRHETVNGALAQLLGRTPEQLSGAMLDDVLPPEAVADAEAVVRALVDGSRSGFRGDTAILHPSGEPRTASIHMTRLENGAGLPPSILVHVVDVTEQRSAQRQVAHLAHHDALTGLANRRGLQRELARQIAHVRRYRTDAALLMLDLDHFKLVNDTFGHEEGDRLLRAVATALQDTLRVTDVVARLGGDELAVVLPGESVEEAEVVAGKVLECVRRAAGATGHDVTASVGVAPFRIEHSTGDDVLREADAAMYAAKAAGGDRHAVGVPGVPIAVIQR